MIFIAIPNLYVRLSNKYVIRATGKKGFYFNEQGKYETDNPILIKVLSQNFEIEDNVVETVEEVKAVEPIEEIKPLRKCKQCGQGFDNQGKLLVHIRQEHK